MSIPMRRRFITVAYVFGSSLILAVLCTLTESFFWAMLFFANLVLCFRLIRIPLRIQAQAIPIATCTNCGMEHDLVGLWTCSCGFSSSQPRHAFLPCSSCGSEIGYFNCPRCSVSVRLH